MQIYVVDIDGTICTETFGDYASAKPIADRIKAINNLYEQGHHITYLTARGMGSTGNNAVASYDIWYRFTESQLNSWGAKYNDLFLGKPNGDVYIDDKGINSQLFFNRTDT